MEHDYLVHYGVLGMKWGIRRYQNEDGSYKQGVKGRHSLGKLSKNNKNYSPKQLGKSAINKIKADPKTAMKIGGAAVGSIVGAYGLYKIASMGKSLDNYKSMYNKLWRDYDAVSTALALSQLPSNGATSVKVGVKGVTSPFRYTGLLT